VGSLIPDHDPRHSREGVHTLGREVILITQNAADIPFDLRHLRYVSYLNNAEGRVALTEALQARMQTILGH
jgi:hypothetical protein